MSRFFPVLFLLLFISCKKETPVKKDEIKTSDTQCFSPHFMKKILELDEVKAQAKFLDSLTKGKSGIAFLIDSTRVNNIWNYSFSAGYNGPERFETYHIFYASGDQCNSLKIADPVSGENISIEAWRQKENEPVQIESDLKQGKYSLPVKSFPQVDVKFLETDFLLEGSQEYSCGGTKFRYFPLTRYKNIELILVPMDCGDFDYRYYLLTVSENKVIGELYVEGEWFDPGQEDNKREFSSYEINKSGKITVKTDHTLNGETQKIMETYYQIMDDGNIVQTKS
ncbi:hypothetical protein EG359_13665 [Chryseobacterium joostei]|uniref:Lipoprotein n=2 Tax=Chryseobacterium joostei TaxID=112234 RepID=A0A1N7JUS4_9FLAO|nr:hypothetical protein EG359_13665 [Chryseobacterium joostei]SIS53112.1 hypothetical protein SAMN05421768_109160 [Chryseobacterium joostei]